MKSLTYNDLSNFYVQTLINSAQKPLTFEPDLNLGEGGATDEEIIYRQELLDLAQTLYKNIESTININQQVNDKIRKIDSYINDFILEGQKAVLKHIPRTWNDGINEGLTTLEEIAPEKKFTEDKIIDTTKDLIIQQQQMNIEDIGLKLRGRIRQYLNIQAIRKNDKTPSHLTNTLTNATPTSKWTRCMIDLAQTDPGLTEEELRELCEDREWESYFEDVQDNIDKLGLFGFLTAHKEAVASALIIGVGVVGDLVADWTTQGDDRVCDDCAALEGQTFSVLDWPEDQHFGDRCYMDNIRLASLE